MRDDIPTLLRDAAADPRRRPDFDALAARGRRQHLAVRATTAVIAVTALVVAGLVMWPDGAPDRMPAIGDQPSTPSEPAVASTPDPSPTADTPDTRCESIQSHADFRTAAWFPTADEALAWATERSPHGFVPAEPGDGYSDQGPVQYVRYDGDRLIEVADLVTNAEGQWSVDAVNTCR